MRIKSVGRLVSVIFCLAANSLNVAQAAPVLTLEEAVDRALEASPRIRAAASQREAADATRQQAGLWHNPEIGLMTENVGGSGIYKGTDAAETTLGITQRIELGGKRSGRIAAAKETSAIGHIDESLARAALIHDTKVAYAEAVAAQEMLTLAGEQRDLAKELASEVGERVNAAREPIIQSRKAEITTATAEVAHMRAQREAGHTRHVYSILWGGHDETYALDPSNFFALTPPPSEMQVEAGLDEGLDLKRMRTAERLGRANYDIEKANAVPDPALNASVRQLSLTDDTAFVVGVSLPLPVLNRNQGNIARARAQMSQAQSETSVAQLSLRNDVFEALETMANAYEHAAKFDQSILPSAEEAFALARDGYRRGRFAYLEVLDSQRTLFAVKEQRIATFNEYHKARAELERLTTPATEKQEKKDAK